MSHGLALASGVNAAAPSGCSVETLRGTYSFATESLQTSEPGAGPFAYAGFVTYDGKGQEREIYTISVNGVVTRDVTETATYTVSPDCIESEVDTGQGTGTQHYESFVSPDGSQSMFIQTDAGVVSAGTLVRVGGQRDR
jgi:hypothetical protein